MDKHSIIKNALEYFDRPDIREQFEADLASLIAIDSVAGEADGIYPYGKKAAEALEAALKLGERYGFATHNYEYHCGTITHGDAERDVGIVAHLDVVPCGGGWTYPPYQLTIDGDRYIGRGTEDDKGPFLIGLYVLRYFKENGIELPFALKMIAGSDEEVGSSDLVYYSSVAKAPWFSFTPDSEFPVSIGEKNIVGLQVSLGGIDSDIAYITGGIVSNAVPDSAEAFVKTDRELHDADGITVKKADGGFVITALGRGAHAAMPETGINAIGVLADYLIANGYGCKSLELVSKACHSYLGEILGIAHTDADFGYLTCVASMIRVENGEGKLVFNIRAIPGVNEDGMQDVIRHNLAQYGSDIVSFGINKGYRFSADDQKIISLCDACSFVLDKECKPYTMGGGTYARELKNCVAFGAVLPEQYSDSDVGGAHQRDEQMKRSDMAKAFQIYVLSLLSLADGLEGGTID